MSVQLCARARGHHAELSCVCKCMRWSHCACAGHTVHALVTLCMRWSHCACAGHTVHALVTLCMRWSHCACAGHTVLSLFCLTGHTVLSLFCLTGNLQEYRALYPDADQGDCVRHTAWVDHGEHWSFDRPPFSFLTCGWWLWCA